MTEIEIKRLIENHAESIFMEIFRPIKAHIDAQANHVSYKITEFEHKINLIHKRQLKIRREFTKITEYWTEAITQCNEEVLSQSGQNKTLEQKVLHKVRVQLESAFKACERIEELYRTSAPDFTNMVANAKAQIKSECDLRIMDILNLEKRYRDLISNPQDKPSIILK